MSQYNVLPILLYKNIIIYRENSLKIYYFVKILQKNLQNSYNVCIFVLLKVFKETFNDRFFE